MKLRLVRDGDAESIASIYAPFVASWVSFEERVPGAAEIARRIEGSSGRFPWLVAETDGSDGPARFAGYAYACEHRAREAYRWSADTSVYLGEEFRGRGVGTCLYRALFALLESQNYVNAYAGVALPNDASVAFHRSAGFEDVGVYRNVGFKAGAWHDVLWLARPLAPRSNPPAEPIRLDALDAERVERILAEESAES